MSFQELEYSLAELSTAPHVLTVQASGRARYETHTNAAWPDLPEIGVYETTLTADELRALNQALATPPLRDLPDHWGRVPSGDRCHRIKVRAYGQTTEKLIGTREPVDPRTQKLISYLDQVVAGVARRPVQVLRLTLSDAAVSAGGALAGVLTLASVGPQDLACRNPLGPPEPAPVRLSLEAWPDLPPGQLTAHHVARGAVAALEPLKLPPGASPTSLVVPLPAGESAAFRWRARLDFRMAGSHTVRLRLASDLSRAADFNLIHGELYSNMLKVPVPSTAVGAPAP